MPQNQSTAPQFPTADQVADAIANHFNVVIVGIANLHPQIPQKTMVEAIAIAIGNLSSGYSKSQDPAMTLEQNVSKTLETRGNLQDAFVRALRKRVPAIDPIQAVAPAQASAEPVPPASAPIAANDGDAPAVPSADDAAPTPATSISDTPADAPASVQAADSAPVADTGQAAA